jgi:hypothetical protein
MKVAVPELPFLSLASQTMMLSPMARAMSVRLQLVVPVAATGAASLTLMVTD